MSKGYILVDLDGTLAYYSPRQSSDEIGDPIQPMVRRVQDWIRAGEDVRIFTARVAPYKERDVEAIRQRVADWTRICIGTRLEVTNAKDPLMRALYDDRAYRIETNTGRLLAREEEE